MNVRPAAQKLRYLAFYMPQYHPIPENDAWWGEGFTEWDHVRGARPLFEDHPQPQIPADPLGYYDLRDPVIRRTQASLAREHGIDGFVFYHYWFNGKRLLHKPLDDMLADEDDDFPFALCWANENWTRAWDGGDRTVLISQRYSTDDDEAHLAWLAPVFEDPRYIRVAGKPLFLVYRASHIPDPAATLATWRRAARQLGVGDLYICRVEAHGPDRGDPRSMGFDGAVEFQPDWERKGPRLSVDLPHVGAKWEPLAALDRVGGVFSYPVAVELSLSHPEVNFRRYRCVTPGWDNSPRRPWDPTIFVGSTPARYEHWLTSLASAFEPYSADENLVFINAWNEWGESNHLEPDEAWGMGYLEATAAARRASGT